LRNDTIGSDEAALIGATEAPTIGQFLVDLPGFRSEIDNSGEQPTRKPLTPVIFSALPLLSNQLHTVASPPVAYLLFLIGLGLLVFEFYTAGIGIAGVVGAGAFVLGAYGLDVLPARWWAVALLVFAMFGFAVDVQTGVPRVWTAIGTACLLLGSFFLYDGVSITWFAYIAGIGGVLLGMVQGMPAMVRTRFSTPTIGREWMLGEDRHGRDQRRSRWGGAGARRAVAGADQSGDAHHEGCRSPGRGDRRLGARGRTGGGGRTRLSRAGPAVARVLRRPIMRRREPPEGAGMLQGKGLALCDG
jgi:hypothetical protein